MQAEVGEEEIGDGCNSDSQCSTMCDSYCPTTYGDEWYNSWSLCYGRGEAPPRSGEKTQTNME